MSAITVSIAAKLDRSVSDSFAQFRKMAKQASDAAEHEVGRGKRGSSNPEIVAARAAHAEQSRLNREILRQKKAGEREADRDARRLARERTREALAAIRERQREERAALREREREERRLASAATSLARQRSAALYRQYSARDRDVDRLATRTSHRATRFMFPRPEGAIGYASRTANDLVRGMGIDVSFGGGINRAKEREAAAVALSNQGWIPGQGKFEDRISAESLRGTSGRVADKYRMDETNVLAGMSKFTDVTGDLKTAQQTIGAIALLSRATGTAIEDAASAAADMSMQLGDIPNKAEVLERLMGVAAMGGKQGAVEMKDLAKYVPQIASLAGTMSGDKATNIGKLLAITQTTRQYGGAGTAAIATTATAGLINTLQTPARVKEFESHFRKYTGGKASVYDKQGQARSIDDILIDSIKSAGTGQYRQVEFKKMWANVKGGKAATGFLNIYDDAERQKKGSGEAAVRAQFAKFEKGLSKEDQEKLTSAALGTKESKAQEFQRKWDKITEAMANRLVPAMDALAPRALQIAGAFGSFISWASESPGKAIGLAISASIARAHLESIFRGAIDKTVKRFYGADGGGSGGSPGGKIGVGGALSSIALGAATFSITDATLNVLGKMRQQEAETASKSLGGTWTDYIEKRNLINSSALPPEEKAKKLQELATHTGQNVALTQESQSGFMSMLPDVLRTVFDSGTAMAVDLGAEQFQRQIAQDQLDAARMMKSAADKLLLKVEKSGPEVDASGRVGPRGR